jgi:hypothetical protein
MWIRRGLKVNVDIVRNYMRNSSFSEQRFCFVIDLSQPKEMPDLYVVHLDIKLRLIFKHEQIHPIYLLGATLSS